MSNYSKTTDFAAKDALPTGNPSKIVKGTEINDEFAAIQTAVNSKADSNNTSLTGTTVISTADINAGAIDNVSIGASTPATSLDVDNIKVDGNTISSTDTDGNIAITPNGTGEVDISKVDIDSGAIDGTTIGGTTPAVVTATTLNATDVAIDTNVLVVDGTTNDNVGIGTATPDAAYKLDVSGSLRATSLYGDGSNITGLATGFTWTSQDMTGLSVKAFTGLPSDITEIVVLMSDLVAAGNNEPRIQLGYGSTTWKTTGYISLSNTVTNSFERPNIDGFSEGFISARNADTNDRITSVFRLYKTDSNVFVGDGQSIVYETSGGVVNTGANMYVGTYTGMVDLGATLTALRVNRQGGNTTNFTSGTVTLGYR